MIGIGIDTGGTYTDAVVYDLSARKVLCTGKTLTTKNNLTIGIENALDQLKPWAVKKAEVIALSTTLATNAALENTGSRAKALMIGMSPENMRNLEEVYASYGFQDLNQIVFLDGRPSLSYGEPEEPDWAYLREKAESWFSDCAAVGVTQIYPEADGGRLENRAKKLLQEKMSLSVTTAHEMFDEVDVLKRGAGTYLNARLVPLITDFLQSVKTAMAERGLRIPIVIIRSDGSQMAEKTAKECPVETLLSGPAASAMGGCVLAREENAVLVDMGGTTTDICLVQDKHPVTADKGIQIGQWKTNVHGLYVDTFLLGGDSAVRFRNEKLYLDGQRVLPLSVLARSNPEIVERLRELARSKRRHTRMLNEFFVLQTEPKDESIYTADEKNMIHLLRSRGPLMLEEFAKETGKSLYRLHTERLEREGILIRSGLTPTDMMVIRGDLTGYDFSAAKEALLFVAGNVQESAEEIPEAVYRLVEKKMYCNIVRILLEQKYPNEQRATHQDGVRRLIELSYEEAVRGEKQKWLSIPCSTELPLVGIGAPVHIFLPEVAKLLGTKAIIPENASVANALGAIASNIVTRVQAHVKAEYRGCELLGFTVYEGEEKKIFDAYEKAETYAKDMVRRLAAKRSREKGSSVNPDIRVSVREIRSDMGKSSFFFESIVEAVAVDLFAL